MTPEAHERCPYCHDLTDDERLDEIECPACRTTHHRACIQELGRCSVHGCEEPIDPGSGEEVLVSESPAMRKIRMRYRDRARQFVRKNARDLRGRIEEALERAQASEGEGHWESAAEAYMEVAYLESLPGARRDRTLQAIRGRMTPNHARAMGRIMRSKHTQTIVRRAVLYAVAVVVGLVGLGTLTIALFSS